MINMAESQPKRILFDVGHGEALDITAPEFKDFKDFLKEKVNAEIWQLSQTPIVADSLQDYDIFFLGAPKNMKFDEDEIVEILHYLRDGGAMVLVSGAGGDQNNNTNVNPIATHLGHEFNNDYLAHEQDYENDDFYNIYVKGIAMEPVCMGTRSVMMGYCSSINVKDQSAAKRLIFSHEPWPEPRNLLVNGYYHLGRYISTSMDIFKYVKRHDNSFLLQSLFYWLGEIRDASTLL